MEQNRRKDSSLSRISSNRLLADSIVGTSLRDATGPCAGSHEERVKCGERGAATGVSDNSAKGRTTGVTEGA
jgi:hypothetical protein